MQAQVKTFAPVTQPAMLLNMARATRASSVVSDGSGGDHGPTRVYDKNEEIFGEDDPAEFFYEVVEGAVRTYKVLGDGRRQIDQFHLPGDLFGLEARASHRFSAEAVNVAVIRPTRRRSMDVLLIEEPQVALRLVESVAEALRRAQAHMLLLGRKCAKEKVATFLLNVARRLSLSGPVELPMSRIDIADHLGLTIETVSRTLTQLERDGAICLPMTRRLITLSDWAALQRLAEGESDDRYVPRLVRRA